MKAVAFREYGPPEVLRLVELPRAVPRGDSILLRVAAAGVNPADWRIRSGQFRRFLRISLPFVPGSDVSGVVEAVGPEVSRFRPGDAVFAMLPIKAGGGYAEFVTVPEALAARAPGVTLGDAASIPLAALTALQALRDKAGVGPGCEALIYGASGGVGGFAIQIAKAMGARVTAATSGRNLEFARGLGADEVVDYTSGVEPLGRRFDAVFDAVNQFPFRRSRALMRANGVAVTVNPVAEKLALNVLAPFRRGHRLRSVFVEPRASDLDVISRWVDEGRIRPHVDRRYRLDEAADAHIHSQTERVRGKLVLIVDDDLSGTRPTAA